MIKTIQETCSMKYALHDLRSHFFVVFAVVVVFFVIIIIIFVVAFVVVGVVVFVVHQPFKCPVYNCYSNDEFRIDRCRVQLGYLTNYNLVHRNWFYESKCECHRKNHVYIVHPCSGPPNQSEMNVMAYHITLVYSANKQMVMSTFNGWHLNYVYNVLTSLRAKFMCIYWKIAFHFQKT